MHSVGILFSCLCQLLELWLLKQGCFSAIKGGITIYWWAFLLYNKPCFSQKVIHFSLRVFFTIEKRRLNSLQEAEAWFPAAQGLCKEAEHDPLKYAGYPNGFSIGDLKDTEYYPLCLFSLITRISQEMHLLGKLSTQYKLFPSTSCRKRFPSETSL